LADLVVLATSIIHASLTADLDPQAPTAGLAKGVPVADRLNINPVGLSPEGTIFGSRGP
jgi:hypothetical protein